MDQNFEGLLNKFIVISRKRWIPSINNHRNGVGLTFENMLNKKEDSMFFPDYKDIEIKCSQRFSRFPIKLFSLCLDGKFLYQSNRLLEKFGTYDAKFKDKKTLFANLKINEKVLINNKYYFEVILLHDRMKLNIYDLNYNLIDDDSYIDFNILKERLILKFSKLALIFASKKEENNKKYFRYYEISLYKLKSFERFIDLLEKNIIKIRLECRIARSGIEMGRQKNRGIIFEIEKDDIDKLFTRIKRYNHDEMIY